MQREEGRTRKKAFLSPFPWPLPPPTRRRDATTHDDGRAGKRRLGARPAEVVALGSPPRGCSLGYSYNAKSVKNAYFVCYQK